MNIGLAHRLPIQSTPNPAAVTPTDTATSPNTEPARKSYAATSPSSAKLHPATKTYSPRSPNTAPAAQSDTPTSPTCSLHVYPAPVSVMYFLHLSCFLFVIVFICYRFLCIFSFQGLFLQNLIFSKSPQLGSVVTQLSLTT